MSKVNLLYIFEGIGASGAENSVLTVIKAIDKTQYKIEACLLIPSDILENELKRLGVPVFVLNITGKWDISSYIKLIRFLRREKIDIVHACLYAPNAIGRTAAVLARTPIIFAWEMGEILEPIPTRHYKVDRILANFTDCIVAPSKFTKKVMIRKENVPPYKIRVIHNSVDLSKFNTSSDISVTRKQLGIKTDEILVGTVSNLVERKGLEYFIKAIPKVVKVYPKIKFLLVGEGPLRSYYIQMANNLNIKDKVILTGFRKDIPEIMNALDLYVCSSIREAFGVAVLEAMALKKPMVVTRVDGMPEMVVENQTAYLVPPKDADSIAQAIVNLLADREKMRQMGEAGFERVKTHFSSEVIIKEIEALYKEFLWKIHPGSQ